MPGVLFSARLAEMLMLHRGMNRFRPMKKRPEGRFFIYCRIVRIT
jgi:hypothetical protein